MANWIKSWQDRFRQGGFLADVVVLAGGTAFSQALLFLATPLITRLYEPADFGVWSLIRSLGSIAAVVACWRYELSIVLPKQDKEAANMFAASVLIAIAMSGLLLLIVSLFGIQVAQLLSTTEILPWLWVLPLMLLLTGIYQAGNYWSTRKNQFSRLAISRIVQSIVLVSVQIGLALTIGPSSSGLIIGMIIGQIAATGALAIQIWQEDGRSILDAWDWQSITTGISTHKNFPLYVAPYSFIGNLSQQMVLLLLGIFTTTQIAGLYSFANIIVMLPIGLISSALNQVFFIKASQHLATGNLGKFVTKVLTSLVIVTTPLFSFFIFNTEWLFTTFFGNKWAESSTYGVWLGLSAFMVLYTSWLDRIYDVLGKQRILLSMDIGYNLVSIMCFAIALSWSRQPVFAVAIYTLITAIYNYLWLMITFKLSEFSSAGIWLASKIFIAIFGCYFLSHFAIQSILSSNSIPIADWLVISIYYICLLIIYHDRQKDKSTNTLL